MGKIPRGSVKSLLFLIALTAFLSGCGVHHSRNDDPVNDTVQKEALAAQPFEDEFDLEDEFEDATSAEIIDPLGGYNRVMTKVNDKVYFWLLKPTASGYRAVAPEGARLAVGRFFRNLLMPVRFTNNLLQLKPKQASIELARFVFNSTVGILGFFDPAAKHCDLQPYPEDFGQTLGYYGVGSGFHIVLPLLGPSNLRDTIGLIPDHFLNPISYVEDSEVRLALRAYKQVNQTSLHIGEYESMKKDAVDLYPFLRDSYEQLRNKQIEE